MPVGAGAWACTLAVTLSEGSSSWCENADTITRCDLDGTLATQIYRGVEVLAEQEIHPALAITTALQAEGREGAALGEHADVERLPPFQFADHTVTAVVFAHAPRPTAETKLAHDARKPLLHDLDVSDVRVGHVGVHARAPVPRWPCTCAACDCFIVSELLVTEGQVVHAPLRGSCGLEGLETDVRDALGGEHVATHDSRVLGRAQDGPRGDGDGHGVQAPLVQRDVLLDHAAQRVDDGAGRYRRRCVAVAPHLRPRASKVKVRRSVSAVNVHVKADWCAVVHEVLGTQRPHSPARGELARPHLLQQRSHRVLSRSLDVDHVGLHYGQRVLADQLLH
mmetsp:Transcript_21808/g.51219  ORF Transcript_21808/g.51219 Transcript_21808/m.51219 type:complete len:337 (-) Transcript_21808:1694-2704(-)